MFIRGLSVMAFVALVVSLSGCQLKEMIDEKTAEESASVIPSTPMEVGESRTVQFPVDGEWHQSDILVLHKDSMLLVPQGLTDGLEPGAVVCRAGELPLYVDGDQSVRFDSFGPLEFKIDPLKAAGFDGPGEVQVTKRATRRK